MRFISITITVNKNDFEVDTIKKQLESNFPNYLDHPEIRYPDDTNSVTFHWAKIMIGNIDMNQKARDIMSSLPNYSLQIQEINEQTKKDRYMPTIYGILYATALSFVYYMISNNPLS